MGRVPHSRDIPPFHSQLIHWNADEPVRWKHRNVLRDYELLITNLYILIGSAVLEAPRPDLVDLLDA